MLLARRGEGVLVTGFATDEQKAVYHNQTAILTWLRNSGHEVSYVRDSTVPSIHLAPRTGFIGRPCPYCGEEMTDNGKRKATKEHKLPRSLGGTLTFENRLIVCRRCNSDKGNLTIETWYYRLWAGRDPRAEHVHRIMVTRPGQP